MGCADTYVPAPSRSPGGVRRRRYPNPTPQRQDYRGASLFYSLYCLSGLSACPLINLLIFMFLCSIVLFILLFLIIIIELVFWRIGELSGWKPRPLCVNCPGIIKLRMPVIAFIDVVSSFNFMSAVIAFPLVIFI